MKYSWKIESIDEATHSMVVEYATDAHITTLNIPMATVDEDLNEHIVKYAPQYREAKTVSVPEVGAAGNFEIDNSPEASEQANIVGSWNEEYIRALIYTVLEEIRESTV